MTESCEGSKTSLVSVEDMINMAIGHESSNKVNYKLIQAILYLMARQMRVLKSKVDLKICDPVVKEKKKMADTTSSSSSSSSTSSLTAKTKKERKVKKEKPESDKVEGKFTVKEKVNQTGAGIQAAKDGAAQGEKEVDDRDESEERKEIKAGDVKLDDKKIKMREEADQIDLSEKKKTGVQRSPDKKAARKKEKSDKAAEEAAEKERDRMKGGMRKDQGVEPTNKIAKEREKEYSKKGTKDEGFDKGMLDERKVKESREGGKADEGKAKTEAVKSDDSESDAAVESEEEIEKADAKEKERKDDKRSKGKKGTVKSSDEEEGEKDKLAYKRGKGKDADEGSDKEVTTERKGKKGKTDKESREDIAKYEAEEKEMKETEILTPKQKEKDVKEKEEKDKVGHKEREKYEQEQKKEKEKTENQKTEKMSPKERAKYEKDMEKLEEMRTEEKDKYVKDKEEIEQERRSKERQRYEKGKEKDMDKIEKMSPKERRKYEQETKKDKEKTSKMSDKEREKYEKEKRQGERTLSGTGLSVKEMARQGEKVLVVEKGPTTYSADRPRVGSINVVTRSEFEILEATVNKLKDKAGPLPMPVMPDNKKLRQDIAKGSASLTDTMQAMQMAARVQAAEQAIERMAGLLTQLAASGALPKDFAKEIGTVTAAALATVSAPATDSATATAAAAVTAAQAEGDDRSRYGGATPVKSVAIHPLTEELAPGMKSAIQRPSVGSTRMRGSMVPGVRASISTHVSTVGTTYVTHIDLGDAMDALSDNLKSYLAGIIGKAQQNCDVAAAAVKSIEDKMIIALKLNARLNTLNSLVTDYSEQLHGFDAGLATQMHGFQEQISLLRTDLRGGLEQLEKANNNAESVALTELTDRYEGLVTELDNTISEHAKLNIYQNQLGDELKSLAVAVEILREQKADRDEVLDGLRDKADIARLDGLLTEERFAEARAALDERLSLCYDKFHRQEQVWMEAIKDLQDQSGQKAELMQLLAAKDKAQQQLRDMQERIDKLALVLGEPMAALVTRLVSKNATCGPCMVPALQQFAEPSYGRPPDLPVARPTPLGEEQPCLRDLRPPPPPDYRTHTCLRWAGGSHTLVTSAVRRVKSPPPPEYRRPPVRVYSGPGTDGHLYALETELIPCVECNVCYRERRSGEKLPEEVPPGELPAGGDKMPEETQPPSTNDTGAGDTGG